ncbi:MAG: hypothetical protein J6Z30_02090 [Pyramidobacter sp.]|nr:hypothetical protein [Pyramidobacter sp.]
MIETLSFYLKDPDGVETRIKLRKVLRRLLATATIKEQGDVKARTVVADRAVENTKQWNEDFNALDVRSWNGEYSGPRRRENETFRWSLEAAFDKSSSVAFNGENAVPENWDELIDLLDRAAPEAELIPQDQIESVDVCVFPNGWKYRGEDAESTLPAERLLLDRGLKTLIVEKIKKDDFSSQLIVTPQKGVNDLIDEFCDFLDGFTPVKPENMPNVPFCFVGLSNRKNERYLITFPYLRGSLPDGWEALMIEIGQHLLTGGTSQIIANEQIFTHGMKRSELMIATVASLQSGGKTIECWTSDDSYYPGDAVLFREKGSRRDQKGLLIDIEYVRKSKADTSNMPELTGRFEIDDFDDMDVPDLERAKGAIIEGLFGKEVKKVKGRS